MTPYDAFISYSHAKDKPVASALQAVVQTLGKPWHARRALRLFRDDTSLAVTPGLWPSIEAALAQSRFLILLASPDAARSVWVDKEVAYWLAHKSVATLLIAVSAGELRWDDAADDFAWDEATPLPPALRGRFPAEPKWVDLRACRDTARPRDPRFADLAADFAATIHGIPKEDLLSQEVRQQRRALRLAWGAAGTLLLLAGLAGWQWTVAIRNERAAIEQGRIAAEQRDQAQRNFNIAKEAADRVVFSMAQGLRNVEGMRADSVRRILDTAQAMMDELARAAPNDRTLQRSRWAMLTEFVPTFLAVGDLARAEAAAADSLTIARMLADAEPDSPNRWRDLSISHNRIGDVAAEAGRREQAIDAFQQGLAIREKLAAQDPDSLPRLRDISTNLDRIADQMMLLGRLEEALQTFRRVLANADKMAADDPKNPQWQRELSLSLSKVANVLAQLKQHEEALALHRRSHAIVQKLAVAAPNNMLWQNDLVRSYDRIGDLLRDAGQWDGALVEFNRGLAIALKLRAADPGNAQWQRGVALSYDRIGEVLMNLSRHAEAEASFRNSLAVTQKLLAGNPANNLWQRDLAIAFANVGHATLAQGRRADALAAYQRSLAIAERLAASNPANTMWQVDLVIAHYRVGATAEPAQAQPALMAALVLAERLNQEGRLGPAQQRLLALIQARLNKLPQASQE